MFHAGTKVEHYILWSARLPYLQKILKNLTFVPFLPLSPDFLRSWIGQNNDFGLFGRRWAKKWHLLHEKPTPSLESAHFFRVVFNFSVRRIFPATLSKHCFLLSNCWCYVFFCYRKVSLVLLSYRYLKSLKVESRQISIIIFYNIEKNSKKYAKKIFTKIQTYAMLML